MAKVKVFSNRQEGMPLQRHDASNCVVLKHCIFECFSIFFVLLILTVNRLCVLVVFAVTVTLTPELTVNKFILLHEKFMQFD